MENQKQKTGTNKKLLLGVAALAVAIVVLLGIYFATRTPASAGQKNITAVVNTLDGNSISFAITTEEEYLRGAAESIGLIEGSESDYGLFVTSVNGVTADDSKQQWWCVTKGGEMLETGVDTTPIADGDQFEFTLTEGY